tara:strand:- start:426 stop:671 length:246 start_codon:yes stop_codon:yes gene_type:complete
MTKDITGYGRKMGMTAGLNEEGKAMAVMSLQGEQQVEGTISFRTIDTGNPEAGGGSGLAGDYAPTSGREDGKTGNPRANNP